VNPFNRNAALWIVIVLLLVTLGLAGMLGSLYRRVGPNRALIVYGKGGTQVIQGGGKVVFPMIQSARELSVELISLDVAGISPQTVALGGAFTAVVFGLAAQQTLGNLIAGMVLLSARPFRVGERVRLQAGAVGGTIEGVVSSLGLLYTTLARGEDRIQIPNNVVLSAAVVPLREPDSVDVRVCLRSGIRPSHVQQILDDQITTPTRSAAKVLLEELAGDDLVVRIQATPERATDGARLADEIIAALATVTSEHAIGRE